MRLAGLRALSLRGGGDSEGDSAGVSEQHGAAIAALQVRLLPEPAPQPQPHLHTRTHTHTYTHTHTHTHLPPAHHPPLTTHALTPQADPEPAVSALARSLLARIDPRRLTSPSRPEAQQAGEQAGQEAGQEAGEGAGEGAGQEAGAEAGEGAGASQSDDDVAASVEPPSVVEL